MRFSTITACLAASVAPAAALSVFNGKAPVTANDDGLDIPGDSPLKLCVGDHDQDIIRIDRVDLAPNPPLAGEQLLIKAKGVVKKTITQGAYVDLVVKYGLIQLVRTRADLCEQISNVDLECPVEAGELELTKEVELPNEIPPGKYTVEANVFTEDDDPITCLTATVSFSRGGFFGVDL